MKKIISIFFLLLLGSALWFAGYYMLNRDKVDASLKEFIFVKFPSFENDDMLLETGELMVGVNQGNVNRYMVANQSEFSSKKEFEKLYKKASENYENYFERDFGSKMYVYVNVVNDLEQSMFFNGQLDFENGELNSVSFKWYTGEEIFTINNSRYTSAVPRKAFKGSNLTVTSKSKIFVDCSASAGQEEYYDMFNEVLVKDDLDYNDAEQDRYALEKIRALCDSIYVDLFNIEHSITDDSQVEGKTKIDADVLAGWYKGTADYDRQAYGDQPFVDIYNHAFENNEFENYLEDTLAFKLTYKNESTISYKYFHLIVDTNSAFLGLYEQTSIGYECKYYVSEEASFVSEDLLYDFTFSRRWNAQSFLLRDNAIVTDGDGIKQLSATAMFFDVNENDFPIELFNIFKKI